MMILVINSMYGMVVIGLQMHKDIQLPFCVKEIDGTDQTHRLIVCQDLVAFNSTSVLLCLCTVHCILHIYELLSRIVGLDFYFS